MQYEEVRDIEHELTHHGILGQRWGIRRFQNKDGSLTEAGRSRLSKQDDKWVKKKSDKVTENAKKKSAKELSRYANELLKTPGSVNKSGKISAAAINAYNQKMASLMSEKVSDLRSPSGKVVKFVAKRGEVGVFMALAGSGRVAYKKTVLDKVEARG